jgi:hypothetical protein
VPRAVCKCCRSLAIEIICKAPKFLGEELEKPGTQGGCARTQAVPRAGAGVSDARSSKGNQGIRGKE